MGIPAHLWLKDDGGSIIKGSSTVQGREGSIEIMGFGHGLTLPIDGSTGKITGTRIHAPMNLEKEFDAASPYLYKAVTTGQNLKSAELHWYRINDAGQEEKFFIILLESVKLASINPGMPNIKHATSGNPIEVIELLYESITWHYIDGNIKHTDAWNKR